MIRGNLLNQALCEKCKGFHWALTLDDNLNPSEYKCCRCGEIEKVRKLKPVKKLELPDGTSGKNVR